MKKILLFLLLPLCSRAQNAVTTYTLTPYANGSSVNLSCAITTSNGQTIDYPVNNVYPVFSRDSMKVQWWNINSGNSVTSMPDSIKHFYTGSFHFLTVKSVDSFFHAVMCK